MSTAYFTIVYQPFLPWKHTERTIRAARERGFETVVAWDHRNSRSDYERICALADTVVPFISHGMTEYGYAALQMVKSDFALMLADDEIPSGPLWDFAASPPSPSRFGIPVVQILGDRYMKGHTGLQERLIWVDGWEILPRTLADGTQTMFEGVSSSPAPKVMALSDRFAWNGGILIWHYLLEAPRAEREAKAKRYAALDNSGDHTTRLFWEEQPETLVPIPADMLRYLPKEKNDGQREVSQQGHIAPAPASR